MGSVMSILRCLFAFTVFVFAGTDAFAQSLDEDTSCGAVVEVLAAPSPDQQKVKEILDFALQTMQAVDRLHRLKGQLEILSQMSEEMRSAVALFVTDRCRSREGLTLADTAIETYEGLRTRAKELALADKDESKRSVSLTVISEAARPTRPGPPHRRWTRQNTKSRTVSSRRLRVDDDLWLKQVD
jgi:DNA-binding FrmR family transcriptional regulator